jgi:uncharacterized protein (DUF433 family)
LSLLPTEDNGPICFKVRRIAIINHQLIGEETMATTLDTVRRLLAELTPAEKAQVLQWVASGLFNAFPGIERQPDIQGGDACIVRTRIPVWGLVRYRQLGMTEADLLRNYPTLRAEDLANAWAYFDAHRDEIQRRIAEDEAA